MQLPNIQCKLLYSPSLPPILLHCSPILRMTECFYFSLCYHCRKSSCSKIKLQKNNRKNVTHTFFWSIPITTAPKMYVVRNLTLLYLLLAMALLSLPVIHLRCIPNISLTITSLFHILSLQVPARTK